MTDNYSHSSSVGRPQRLGFWLLPFNKASAALVSSHPWNLSRHPFDKDTSGFWIDFSNPEKQKYTVGCSDSVDIYLPQVWNSSSSSGISELHTSFRAVTETGPILLCDESEYSSTEPFEHGSRSYTVDFSRKEGGRSVLVAQGINSLVAFGHGRFYQFELRWESDGLEEFRMQPPVLYALGPSRVKTKRYVLGEKVGGGTFGNVYRALDLASGGVMAVKKFHRLSGSNKKVDFAAREITSLLKLNSDGVNRCDHIIQLLSYLTTPSGTTEIFLPLHSGSLKTLITKILPPSSHFQISNLVLHQMLLALCHLDHHSIIHRDINPENILFSPSPSGDRYTPLHPPELYTRHFSPHRHPHRTQTCKIDIFSLFATTVWTRDARFRKGCEIIGPHLVHVWLNRIAGRGGDEYRAIRRMACFDPGRRPSAREQLEILEVEAEMEEMEELDGLEEVEELEEIRELERLEELRRWEEWEGMREMEARFAGLGLGWNAGMGIEGGGWQGWMRVTWRCSTIGYVTGAIREYGWDTTNGAWSKEGYVLPGEAPRDQEGWIQDYDGQYDLVKSPGEEADAALAKWKAWYLTSKPEKEVVRKRSVRFKEES
ncbi:kinase-like domain-containing protein [Sordaria brevicollis]|uniref:Kinase-like domain-containing protein n=1 Tax=Sordaria brevicollis TaxID=83679 RepID=A0AAE0PBL0_SORBR|nr:kinase-like domain-containing protein [Sordaria brevicollis]